MGIEEIYKYHDYFCGKCKNTFTSKTFKEKDIKAIENFILLSEKNNFLLAEDFLFTYLTFQFNYWYELDSRFGKGNAPSGWIYGKKAFKRWLDKNEHYLFFSQQFQGKLGLDLEDLTVKRASNKEVIEMVENRERERYLNTEYGLTHCVSYTSLFLENNVFCKICTSQKECKEVKECN